MISTTANKDLMSQAREILTGKWGTVAIATLVYCLLVLIPGIIPTLGYIITVLIAGPLCFGYTNYMLSTARGGTPDIPVLLSGFNNFVKAFCLCLLILVIVLVGMILFIIPGIIASLALSMAWFIMLDNPQMGVVDVATESYNMTRGNLWKIFCLIFRFIGWILLSCITFGIGFLFLLPYMQISLIKFYEEIKGTPKAEPSHIS